jgi:hypothetical protein
MSDDGVSPSIKVGSWISIALGPVLSQHIPMASDLRPWAFGFSAIVSVATRVWFLVRLSGVKTPRVARREFFICCVAAIILAFGYIAINVLWTIEHGDYRDDLLRLSLIGTFGLSAGSITGALAVAAKLKAKHE